MHPAARRVRWLAICGLLSSAALAGPLPDRFTLGRYIPDDVWMYIHNVQNPERAWLDAEWADVITALRDSGIHRDFVSIASSLLEVEDREKMDQLVKALEKVQWSELATREFAVGERMTQGLPAGGPRAPYDYFVLMRGTPGKAEANMVALVNVLKHVASWSQKIRLVEDTRLDMTVWWIGSSQPRPGHPQFRAYVFRKKDITGFAFGSEAARDVISLVDGKTEHSPVVSLPLFEKALSKVPPPEDTVMFFNTRCLFAGVDGLLKRIVAESQTSGDLNTGRTIEAVKKILDQGNIFEYSIMTVETQEQRELTHSVVRLHPDRRQSVVASAIFDRTPFKRFDEFIPADATGFAVETLIDLEPLYEFVIKTVKEDLPGGEKYIVRWNDFLASLGFDPRSDLFSWWSGEMVSVSLPPSGPSLSNAESVLFLRVKDGELASRKIDSLLDALCCKFQLGGQSLIVSDVQVGAERFRQVTHPMFMMLARPVVGVHGDWLIVGSSCKAIGKCLAVADGKTPSITVNERFNREGLVPDGSVTGVAFKDLSHSGEDAGVILQLVTMMIAGYAEALPDSREMQDAKRVLRLLTPTLMKLGPVLQKIDFYSSSSRITTLEDNLSIRTEGVTTFKPPPGGMKTTTTTK